MQEHKPRILVLSPMPHHYGGLANNMRLYLSSNLAHQYDLICLNTAARLSREKDPDKPSIVTGLYAFCVVPRVLYALVTSWPHLVYMKAGTKWGFWRDLCVIFLCKLFRRKLVCHLHSKSAGTLFLDDARLRRVFRWAMQFPDRVVVLSEQLKQDFATHIDPTKLAAIDNIVDTTVFDRPLSGSALEQLSRNKPVKVLFVGRLSQNKGLRDLFEAVRLILSQVRNVQFQLAGLTLNEAEDFEIRRFCSDAPYNKHVWILGSIQGEVKIKTFIEADILVLPTHNDNMPNAILEAFAAGLPVVSTNVGQIPYMIEDGINGFVVEVGDIERLSKRLMTLIGSGELRARMAQANYIKAREKYSVEAGARKMQKVFEELLARGKKVKAEKV